jgi:hypothetical protein
MMRAAYAYLAVAVVAAVVAYGVARLKPAPLTAAAADAAPPQVEIAKPLTADGVDISPGE